MLAANDRSRVNAFFSDRLGLHASADFRGVLHVPDEYTGQLAQMDHVAVAIGYNGFVGRTCCIHIVIQRPDLFSRALIREAFEYPFLVCGCEAVLALIDSHNDKSLDLTRRIGFSEIARIPHGGHEGDLIAKQMLRADCRWLRKPH
jgi:RimJ/RimL family protein N-acetyltransferase